MMMNDPLASRK